MFAVGFSCFYFVEVFSFYSYFSGCFMIKICWILSNAFSIATERSCEIFFPLHSVRWYSMLIGFCILTHPCISWINPIWSWLYVPLKLLLKLCGGPAAADLPELVCIGSRLSVLLLWAAQPQQDLLGFLSPCTLLSRRVCVPRRANNKEWHVREVPVNCKASCPSLSSQHLLEA
jgi:hypothetical protein